MQKRTPIKNHQEEIHLITQRCAVALVMMIVLIILLICRLAYLQLTQNKLYTTLSNKNSLDLIAAEPTRGLIYDRNGILLAENIPVFSLDVIPNKVGNLPRALANIAKIVPLTDEDIVQFQKQLKQHKSFDEIPLKMRLSETDVARLSENAYQFPGFIIKARLIRHYPFDASFSHVIGYVARINVDELQRLDVTNYSASNYIGKLGIEKSYETELHGTVGSQQVENDASGQPVRMINQKKSIPGKNLYLTLDSRLQLAAEKALEGHRGAVVAIQPRTGQILALVSQPSYDPNLFVAGINSKDFQVLQKSPDKPLYNRALRGLYPFASTIKPFMAIEGLDSGVTTANTSLYDPGWFKLPNSEHEFHDWMHHGHGHVNLYKAVACSCDTYFYDLASKMGIERMNNILRQFGFGQLTGIDVDEELPGVVASPEWKKKNKGQSWYPGDTIISGIGQGYMQTTPLQLAFGVSTIANHGKRFQPHLVLGQQEPGKNYEPQQPAPLEPVELSDPKYWDTVITAMQGVITSPEGTGKKFGLATYTVAAKTGTAQVFSFNKKHFEQANNEHYQAKEEKLRDHSLFIAFAPVDNPQIAIAVIVENATAASNVARQVMDYYLINLLKIAPAPRVPVKPKKETAAQQPETPANTDETTVAQQDEAEDTHAVG